MYFADPPLEKDGYGKTALKRTVGQKWTHVLRSRFSLVLFLNPSHDFIFSGFRPNSCEISGRPRATPFIFPPVTLPGNLVATEYEQAKKNKQKTTGPAWALSYLAEKPQSTRRGDHLACSTLKATSIYIVARAGCQESLPPAGLL